MVIGNHLAKESGGSNGVDISFRLVRDNAVFCDDINFGLLDDTDKSLDNLGSALLRDVPLARHGRRDHLQIFSDAKRVAE